MRDQDEGNPATGEVLGEAPDASVADAQAAIAAARRAFDTTSWPTDVEFRTRCLNQLHKALTEHKEEMRELTITLQAGSDAQARANEYFLPAGELELVSLPVQFNVTAPELRPAPAFAAQTEEFLQELGLDWDRIIALKAAGAVT